MVVSHLQSLWLVGQCTTRSPLNNKATTSLILVALKITLTKPTMGKYKFTVLCTWFIDVERILGLCITAGMSLDSLSQLTKPAVDTLPYVYSTRMSLIISNISLAANRASSYCQLCASYWPPSWQINCDPASRCIDRIFVLATVLSTLVINYIPCIYIQYTNKQSCVDSFARFYAPTTYKHAQIDSANKSQGELSDGPLHKARDPSGRRLKSSQDNHRYPHTSFINLTSSPSTTLTAIEMRLNLRACIVSQRCLISLL